MTVTHSLTEAERAEKKSTEVGLAKGASQRADLLARIAIALGGEPKFDNKNGNVGELRGLSMKALPKLQFDYMVHKNPVFVWEALRFVCSFSLPTPEWVAAYLGQAAAAIMGIRAEVQDGLSCGKEAARIGRALGFGVGGPGRGGWFKNATMLERDRIIYIEVHSQIKAGSLPKYAYDTVACHLDIRPSAAKRAYLRVRKSDQDAIKFLLS